MNEKKKLKRLYELDIYNFKPGNFQFGLPTKTNVTCAFL